MSGGTSYRLRTGGLVGRDESLKFQFDGTAFEGYAGDTLASALLGNGVQLVGRSFKYHRPRGVLSAGPEEPNALVELRSGAHREPNTRATTIELFDGLEAESQNRFPSLSFDLMAVNNLLSPFLGAGFYYKTFMWPAAFWEKLYEPIIRRAAGLGRLSGETDPDTYDKGFLHCDLLVIGAGPAGLMAALTAARAGARVILADEDFTAGGRLLSENGAVGDNAGSAWAAEVMAELAAAPNVRYMPRTTVFGVYDHGIYGAVERITDHLHEAPEHLPRQCLWKLIAKRSILAAGAIERPLVFGGNDRPGTMLAGAVRTYVNRFGVAPGRHVAVFTNNDDGWRSVAAMLRADIDVSAVIDVRAEIKPADLLGADAALLDRTEVVAGGRVTAALGGTDMHGLEVRDANNRVRRVRANALAISGGWNPTMHLTCHQNGRPTWNDNIAAFVPSDNLPAGMTVAGAANGEFSTAAALRSGQQGALDALADLGFSASAEAIPTAEDDAGSGQPYWYVPDSKGPAFVDFQNDVTVKDIQLSHQEGFRAVEHLKRYTTLGMATDQGKTANVPALAIMAELTGRSIPETGTTTYRPPYTPIAIGAFAGRSHGKDFRPTRYTPSHEFAARRNAVFVETGNWLRAQWFPLPGETHWRESVDREVLATRASVGVCDVTTLGKIDIQGPDAAEFLDRVYTNMFSTLKVGRARYGLMLREDGLVMDDGTTTRFGEHEYLMTTTTANAVGVFRHLEYCRQVLWPTLDVHLISTTDHWAQFAVAGPNSRRLLEQVVDAPFDISNDAFPYMAAAELTVCNGVRARLYRLSFSGELAYEIAVPSQYGGALIDVLMEAGKPFDVVPYGTEALGVMRVEKGHAAGNELNGTTTAADLGLGRMVSQKKDCIGKVMANRPGLTDPDRPVMVGFKPVNPKRQLSAGAHFIGVGQSFDASNDQGYLTSVAYSPMLETSIGLGFIRNGVDRYGERVVAADLVRDNVVEVEIVSPHFFDPKGGRLRG
ncbi:MAG: sarcosine oxidase subunit alpha family protein [Pseudomonadota bacterium]